MTSRPLIAVLALLAMLSTACGAAFALDGEQSADPIGFELPESASEESEASEPQPTSTPIETTDEPDESDTVTETPVPDEVPDEVDDANRVGVLINEPGALEGATLVSPALGTAQYLVGNDGQVITQWSTGAASRGRLVGDAEILPNGLLLRTVRNSTIDASGATGTVELADANGATVWSCILNESWFGGLHLQGDATWIEPNEERGTEPWGSLLLSAYLIQSEAQLNRIGKAAPPDSDRAYADALIELVPNVIDTDLSDEGGAWRTGECGTTIWQWYSRDRIANDAADVDAPRRADWTEFTSIDYSAELDMIAVAARGLGEVWIIDRQVDTRLSASDSPSAEILSRWQVVDDPTGVEWAEPTLLVVADQAVYNLDFGGDEALPIYELSGSLGHASRLDNGNLLITDSEVGRVIEIDPATDQIVWEFVSPIVGDGTGAGDDAIIGSLDEAPPGTNQITAARKYSDEFLDGQ